MGEISPASGLETETMVDSGNSSKIRDDSGSRPEPKDVKKDDPGSDRIWTYRGPPSDINRSDAISFSCSLNDIRRQFF